MHWDIFYRWKTVGGLIRRGPKDSSSESEGVWRGLEFSILRSLRAAERV